MWFSGSPQPWIVAPAFLIILIIALFVIYDGAVKKTNINQLLVSPDIVEVTSKPLATLFPKRKIRADEIEQIIVFRSPSVYRQSTSRLILITHDKKKHYLMQGDRVDDFPQFEKIRSVILESLQKPLDS